MISEILVKLYHFFQNCTKYFCLYQIDIVCITVTIKQPLKEKHHEYGFIKKKNKLFIAKLAEHVGFFEKNSACTFEICCHSRQYQTNNQLLSGIWIVMMLGIFLFFDILMFLLLGIIVPPLLTKLSYRQLIVCSCLISAFGFGASSFAPNIYVLWFTYAVLTGNSMYA